MSDNCTGRNSKALIQIILILLPALLGVGELRAQDISEYFEAELPVSYQKLYLHTDRTLYFEQDTLWFAAYLVDGQTHRSTQHVCNGYIELVNAEGDVLERETYIIQNGHGAGQLILRRGLPEGNFLLRAYTDYLRNFPPTSFFAQPIRISHTKDSDELNKPDTEFIAQTKIDLSFMPEGGFLLADATNAVSFRAVDEKGLGIQVSGKILDDTGEEVQNFSSTFQGAGKFYFYHAAGRSFHAQIDGYEQSFELPKARG